METTSDSFRELLEEAVRNYRASASKSDHPLAGWGTPEKHERAALYEETYQQILADIDEAMSEYDERIRKADS